MIKSYDAINRVLNDFEQGLAAVYGDRLRRVVLFGSYARGEASEDSDIDVAIILKGPVNRYAETRRVSELRADISLRECCLLMPFFLSEEEFDQQKFPLCVEIRQEGVPG